MNRTGASGRQRVAMVTGGGGGIGAAVAEAIASAGTHVVTVDPLVSLDGSEQLAPPEETTAGRIEAAGGSARASSVSVTDRDAVHALVADLVTEFGGLDAVVNVAGITRPTSFASGTEEDWRRVLEVHLDGYRNVLDAALPVMAAAGHGRVLGVTSGSGWRPADAGAYSCAKRAVAALTWQLGRCAPRGVVVNAVSPIAMTRMVEAAMRRAGAASSTGGSGGRSGSSRTGGLSLGSMPSPGDLGPLGAHLVSEDFTACNGQVVFAGGSEIAVVEQPHLLEVLRTNGIDPLDAALEVVLSGAFVPAEEAQTSRGGSNARFGSLAETGAGDGRPPPAVGRCVVVTDREGLGAAVVAAIELRGISCHVVAGDAVGFEAAAAALVDAESQVGQIDAVVVARSGMPGGRELAGGWARVLAEHDGIVERIHGDAAWARAVADLVAATERPIRLVTLVDASTAGGHSRAQAAIQLARAARSATDGRVHAFAVGVEDVEPDARAVGSLAAHLVGNAATDGLAGAELALGPGWVGLRSHPRSRTSLVLADPTVPPWLDDALAEITGQSPGAER